jgi:predicted DNA-binding ribbon-helix-helix protein
LEGAFWNALKEIAAARNIRVSELVKTIKIEHRRGSNLSSAIRLFISRLLPTASLMAPNPKHPPGPAMTLGNMRELGVQRLIASCLNDACRHTALIDVWSYPAETEVPYFSRNVSAPSAATEGTRIDVRSNWSFVPSPPLDYAE